MNDFILMRDDLYDIGQIPSRGSYCSSPDLIVHEQVADPQSFFSQNYSQDVNEPIKTGLVTNFIYARGKNLSTVPKQAFFHLYASKSSLFMTPSSWKNNVIRTYDGKDYAASDIIQPGQIGVSKLPFIFDAKNTNNYCHVGYVTDSANKKPEIPNSFSSYDEFCVWIKQNPHICLRNFSSVRTNSPAYEQLNEFSNPSTQEERLVTIEVSLKGVFPEGTLLSVDCAPMGIATTYKIDPKKNPVSLPYLVLCRPDS